MNTKELKKFLTIILPFAVTSFAVKKCLLIYKDPNYQQRWISKMKELLPPEGVPVLNSLLTEGGQDVDTEKYLEDEFLDDL